MGLPETTEIYGLTVLEARSLKSRYQHGHVPCKTWRGSIFPYLLLASHGLPEIFGVPWLVDADINSFSLHGCFLSLYVCPVFSFHKNTSAI